MPCYNIRTGFLTINILSILVIFTLCSAALEASSLQNKDSLTGTWTGTVKDKEKGDIKTDFTIKPAGDNNDSYQYFLKYGVPRSCRLDAEELSVGDNLIKLKFNEASGGFCDKLYHGEMTIKIEDDNHLSVLIKSRSGEIEETAILERK